MLNIFFKPDELGAICLLQKYRANKIVRAGSAQPAQPAQPDGMQPLYFSKTNEMLTCVLHFFSKPTKWSSFVSCKSTLKTK